MTYVNKRKSVSRLLNIENAIEWLTIESSEFITATSVKEKLGAEDDVTPSTIRRYMELSRETIDRHNRKVFGTDNFMSYKKMLSVHNIKEAIRLLNDANDRLSRRKVAKEAGVHFNTVQSLWNDEDIQDELNRYNQVFKQA
jgi:DNA-binding transcriptional regulator YhcF (GntR family)